MPRSSANNGAGAEAASAGAGAVSYLTLRAGKQTQAEFVDRKSRFIAQLVHVEGEDEANEFIASVRSKHYDARHNVPAWILADGRERQSVRVACPRSRRCAERASRMSAAW